MRLTPAFEINGFSGINNVTDSARMAEPVNGILPLIEATNVDIDDSRMISRSKGNESLYAGTIHSLWSNSRKEFGLCMEQGTLKKVTYGEGFLTVTPLYSGLDPAARMRYVETDDRIFMTNGSFIGYLRDSMVYPLVDPDQTYKTRMPAGHLIEFYNNQLYVAVDSVIFYSDALAWQRTDLRKNFIPLLGRVRMIQAVQGGLFVSDTQGIHFLSGGTAKELVLNPKSPNPVYPGGFCKIEGEMIGTSEPILGEAVVMMNSEGIFLGGPEGHFLNVTKNRYAPDEMGEISSLVRINPTTHQVLFIGELARPERGGEIEIRIPTLSISLEGQS
jgi:hypothetical protein